MTATTISTKTTTAKTIGGGDSLTITSAGGITAADSVVLLNFSQAGTATVDNSGALVATTGRVFYTTGTAASAFSFVLYNRSGGTITGKTDVMGTNKKTLDGGDITVDNSGAITAQGGRAFNINEYINLAHFNFTNRSGGTVQSTDDGLRLSTTTTGATASANAAFTGYVTVDNSGTIKTVGTGSGQAIDFADLNETALGHVVITNRAGGLIQAADADAIRASRNADVENYGTIQSQNATSTSTGNDGIDFQSNDGGVVNNFQGGSIIGARHGITGTQVVTVNNDGVITGQLGSGLNMDTASTTTMTVVNTVHGVITGNAGNANGMGVDGDGVDIDGLANITNSGIIQALGHATIAGSDGTVPLNEAITIGGGTITNQAGGLIHSVERAITVDDSNDGNAYASTTIVNHGTITGDNGSAIFITDILGDTITNDGTINGSVTTGDGNDVITNSGTLNGALATRGGDDLFYLSGSSIGAIDGGAGNDVIHVMGASTQLTFGSVTGVEQLFVDAGMLTLADAESYSSGTTIASAATLTVGSGTAGSLAGAVADNGTLVFARTDSITESDTISGSGLVKAAGGTLVLSGNNSFGGGLELVSGTAEIGAMHAAGTGAIGFDSGAQVLVLDTAAFTNGDFANVIDTFAHADKIDLAGVSASATLALNGGNTLTITDGGSSYTLHFDPSQMFGDQRFHLAGDGNGGSFLSFADDVAPVAASTSFSTDEDTVLHGTVTATDADGDALTYALGTGPQHGSLTLNADGSFTYTANADYNGSDSFTFTANDGTASSSAGTISLTVNPVNDPPALTGTPATLADATEDTVYTIKASDLLAGYTDVDGDTLSVSNLRATHGTIVDNGDGTYGFTPDANFNGPVILNYGVVDGHGGSAQGSLSLTVDPVNDDPALTGMPATLADATEDTAYTIKASDLLAGYTDVDGDTLSVANLRATHGDIADNGDGTYTYTPTANYNGPVTLSYGVVDGHGGSAQGSLALTVDPVNDAPALTGTPATLADGTEDTAYTIKASDLLAGYTDVDGDTLSVANLRATNGDITDNGDGTYTFTPNANYSGLVLVNYGVVDGQGGSVAASRGLTIDAVNDAPALTGTPAMLANATEDTAYTIKASDLLAGYTDVDGDTLSVANLRATHGTIVDNGDGTYTYTPDANFNGSASVNYGVVDGHGGSVAASRGLTIDAVDDAPDSLKLTSGGSVAENSARGTTVATVQGHDVDTGDKLSYSLADNAGGAFSINAKTGLIQVLDPRQLDYESATSKTIDVVVTDSHGLTYHHQFTIQVTNVVETHTYNGTSGDDTFTATGSEPYVINGGGGNDVLTGGDGNDTITGGAGFDEMHGGKGDDHFIVTGGFNADSFDGGAGTDTILAGADNTGIGVTSLTAIEAISADGHSGVTLLGSTDNDVLDFSAITLTGIYSIQGLAGNDTITGSAGADRIIGGLGKDIMTGGDGADTFVFTKATESVVGAQADHITDFVSGKDVIDLSAIDANIKLSGDQAFTFIGNDPFTGLGQLRVGMDDAGHLAVFGNNSGDLKADFEIVLDSTPTVHASDFVL